MSAPAPVRRAARSSGRGPRALASWNCQEDRFDEPVEFRFEYGAGRSALVRCIRTQVREARFECAQGGCEDSGDFAHDDGAGALATSRCLRDELD